MCGMRLSVTVLLACCLMTVAACRRAGDPYRTEGVNAMVVPLHDAAAPEVGQEGWVFRVTLPGGNDAAESHLDLASSLELIEFVGEQPAEVRHNGIWVLVNDETELSPALKKILKDLVDLATREQLALFLCRSSEFPYGYERVN